MAYSAAQQAKLDAAKASLDAAQSTLDSSTADANSKHSSLGNCVKGKGTTSNCSDGQPLGTGGYPKFGETGNSGVCNVCNSLKDCLSDCCNEATCVNRMNAYNSSITSYNSAVSAYDNSKKNYDAVLEELANDPDVLVAVAEAEAGATEAQKTKRAGYVLAGFIIVVVIGGIILWWKYIKGK